MSALQLRHQPRLRARTRSHSAALPDSSLCLLRWLGS